MAQRRGLQGKKKFTMEGDIPVLEPLSSKSVGFTVKNFVDKQNDFMTVKRIEGIADRTMEDYVKFFKYINDWIKVEITDIENRGIEKSVFLGYIGYMVQKYKPCTVNLRLRVIKCYLRWLYSEKFIQEDIAEKLKLVKVPKDTILPLSPSEVRKLFRKLDLSIYPEYRDFVAMVIMLETGIRVNELCNLRVKDIYLKDKLIVVRAEVAKTREKRMLPISGKTLKYIQKLLSIAEKNGELYLFNSAYGGKMETLSMIRGFTKYGKRVGITHRCTPHVFRHTFAVEAVKSGMDIFTLMKLMGHANISTTRQYIQLSTDDLVKSHSKANILGRFF